MASLCIRQKPKHLEVFWANCPTHILYTVPSLSSLQFQVVQQDRCVTSIPDTRKLESQMDEPRSSTGEPRIRFLVACPRSGSTLLMRIFAESAFCAVTSRPLLMGKADSTEGFSPDYSILEDPSHHSAFISAFKSGKQFLICKEELGNDSRKGECLYNVCPNPSTYTMTRPIFLFRDPIRVFDSWKNVGWTDAQSLIDCYINMFHMLAQAPSPAVSCLVYERLIRKPETEIECICARWGIPFSESILKFDHPFASAFTFSSDRERDIYCEKKPLGLFKNVETGSSFEPDVPYHNLLSNAGKDHIEEHVGFLYVRCWEDDILRLRAILTERTWIGFDLDDTLHEFRRSSGIPTNRVLAEISKRHGIPIPALKDEYSKVLKLKTANAFSDGKTSFDYRRERFASVLTHLSLPQDDHFISKLLELNGANLTASLELKCGALDLLSLIKDMDKKIVVITEGPQDAQERAVRGLGIDGFIDFLATTANFGVAKTDGLSPRVLDHLGVTADDMAYIGDNEERDMKPALMEGIFSIHLAEMKHVSFNTIPPKINTLRKLQYILSNDRCPSPVTKS